MEQFPSTVPTAGYFCSGCHTTAAVPDILTPDLTPPVVKDDDSGQQMLHHHSMPLLRYDSSNTVTGSENSAEFGVCLVSRCDCVGMENFGGVLTELAFSEQEALSPTTSAYVQDLYQSICMGMWDAPYNDMTNAANSFPMTEMATPSMTTFPVESTSATGCTETESKCHAQKKQCNVCEAGKRMVSDLMFDLPLFTNGSRTREIIFGDPENTPVSHLQGRRPSLQYPANQLITAP